MLLAQLLLFLIVDARLLPCYYCQYCKCLIVYVLLVDTSATMNKRFAASANLWRQLEGASTENNARWRHQRRPRKHARTHRFMGLASI